MMNAVRSYLLPHFRLAADCCSAVGSAALAIAPVGLSITTRASLGAMALISAPATAQSAQSVTYRQEISHNAALCSARDRSSVMVTVTGVKNSTGTVRVQSYRGVKDEWLKKGKWLNRIELPARAGTMTVCMPVPGPGTYGIAVRHDVNNNRKTDLSTDGGAMSNNPSLNIFNLGKPSYKKTQFQIGRGSTPITINMRYR